MDMGNTNYISLGNGGAVGNGYDIEVLRLAGDEALVCWEHVATKRSGITEVSLEGRSLEQVARSAGNGPGDWGVTWDDEDGYMELAERWDAARKEAA